MYPVAIGTNDPKMFPPRIRKPMALPTIFGFHTKSLVRAMFKDRALEMQANEIETKNKSRYSLATMLVSRTTLDSRIKIISNVRRLPCFIASRVRRLSLNFPTSKPNATATTYGMEVNQLAFAKDMWRDCTK